MLDRYFFADAMYCFYTNVAQSPAACGKQKGDLK